MMFIGSKAIVTLLKDKDKMHVIYLYSLHLY